jgi:hypothetical protein
MIFWGLSQPMRERNGTGILRRSMMRPSVCLPLALGAVLAAAPVAVTAAPLDPLACEQLQHKMDALRNAGVEADMERGPAWARANMTSGRLQLISEYIDIDEKLNFRCGLAKRFVLPTTIEGGEEEVPTPGQPAAATTAVPLPQKSPGKSQAAAKKPAAAKAKEPKSAQPTQKKAPAKGAEHQKKASEQKVAPKKRAKTEDAYRPPQTSAGGGSAPSAAKQ